MTWQDKVKLVEHYKAIDMMEHSLWQEAESDKPWEFVTEIDRHDYHNFDGNNTVSFIADHPCGLRFRWYMNIINFMDNNERRAVNTKEIQEALANLKYPVLDEFQRHLIETRSKGIDELIAIANEYKALSGKLDMLGMMMS